MVKRFFALLFLALALGASTQLAHAQDPNDAAAVVKNQLVSHGYDVIDVGYFPDEQGNPRSDAVFVQMETITTDFADRYLINQALRGFETLALFYPRVDYYIVVLRYDRWLYFFVTTPPDWDDVYQKRVKALDFWNNVRRTARVYDTVSRQYISDKDFINQQQLAKNQSSKDFTGTGKSPLPPTNTNPDAQAENILVEPSTTYLPADGKAEAFVLATLTDQTNSGLPNRGVNFTYEVRGQEESNLGTAQTNKFGTARARITSSRALDLVLLRAATANLSGEIQMLVGPPPGTDRPAQVRAVERGLLSQGYKDVDADFGEFTTATGRVIRQGFAAVRVASGSFDREVYSQLARMMGTLRTVMPDANVLRPILVYPAPDGHEYSLVFSITTDIWDAYARGDIGENQFWQSLNYDMAIDENGRTVEQKDFLSKNFTGVEPTRYSQIERTVEASVTQEEWGEQLTVGSFLVPLGGVASNFKIAETGGNATGLALYATPDYTNPIFEHRLGDSTEQLTALRLEAGQYILHVVGGTPPARIVLTFTEYLAR